MFEKNQTVISNWERKVQILIKIRDELKLEGDLLFERNEKRYDTYDEVAKEAKPEISQIEFDRLIAKADNSEKVIEKMTRECAEKDAKS